METTLIRPETKVHNSLRLHETSGQHKLHVEQQFHTVQLHVQLRIRDYPTLFKVVFHTEVVCQKIQHVPLVMLVTFFQTILRSLQDTNA